jgi:ankyrin repeat protein
MPERTYSNSDFNTTQKLESKNFSSLPLHIAIEYKGSLDVLQHLTQAAPEIVAWKDGPNNCNAISALLYQKRFDMEVISMLIRMHSEALLITDRLQNTSLHVACAQGAPLALVDLLCEAYPQALLQRNILGLTPLQISQQNGLCSIEVSDYLHEMLTYPLEFNADHLLESKPKKQKLCVL